MSLPFLPSKIFQKIYFSIKICLCAGQHKKSTQLSKITEWSPISHFIFFVSALTKNVSLFSFHVTSFCFIIIQFRLYYPDNICDEVFYLSVNINHTAHTNQNQCDHNQYCECIHKPSPLKRCPGIKAGVCLTVSPFFIKKFFLFLYWCCRCTLWFCCNWLYWLCFCWLIL